MCQHSPLEVTDNSEPALSSREVVLYAGPCGSFFKFARIIVVQEAWAMSNYFAPSSKAPLEFVRIYPINNPWESQMSSLACTRRVVSGAGPIHTTWEAFSALSTYAGSHELPNMHRLRGATATILHDKGNIPQRAVVHSQDTARRNRCPHNHQALAAAPWFWVCFSKTIGLIHIRSPAMIGLSTRYPETRYCRNRYRVPPLKCHRRLSFFRSPSYTGR